MIGTLFAAFFASHLIGDYFLQTPHQAAHKGCDAKHGTDGDHIECDASGSRAACVGHVVTHTLITALFVIVAVWADGLDVSPTSVTVGLTLSGLTHYAIDRRPNLRRFADMIGKGEFYRLGDPRPDRDDNLTLGTGWHYMDQAAHVATIFAIAVIMVLI